VSYKTRKSRKLVGHRDLIGENEMNCKCTHWHSERRKKRGGARKIGMKRRKKEEKLPQTKKALQDAKAADPQPNCLTLIERKKKESISENT